MLVSYWYFTRKYQVVKFLHKDVMVFCFVISFFYVFLFFFYAVL
ncbi:Uncharacterised protein [Klebsiella pneumoniae]|nr:Uncharacterised protein [Klebsiella pneumoniae]SSJ61365.1 Uncharacterised protein [Klebsiella pneumoniae]